MAGASPQMGISEIAGLLDTLISPKKGERLLFLTDYGIRSSSNGIFRAELLSRWYKAAGALSQQRLFHLLPIVRYPETGKNNGDLPYKAVTHDGGHVNNLEELIASSNIAIAMNEYSASAPLRNIATRCPSLRIISKIGRASCRGRGEILGGG